MKQKHINMSLEVDKSMNLPGSRSLIKVHSYSISISTFQKLRLNDL